MHKYLSTGPSAQGLHFMSVHSTNSMPYTVHQHSISDSSVMLIDTLGVVRPHPIASFNPSVDTVSISSYIKERCCKVTNPISGESGSGFFIDSGLLLTSFHLCGGFEDDRPKMYDTDILVLYQDDFLKGKMLFTPKNANSFYQYDYCLLTLISNDGAPFQGDTPFFQILEDHYALCEGEDVYFGGFPLSRENYNFSSGKISAIETNEVKTSIFLDATVVEGHSGSPLIVVRNNALYLAGFIDSAVASQAKAQRDLERDLSALKQSNTLWVGFLDREINPMAVFAKTLDFLKRNISTGIGSAVHIQHVTELLLEGKTIPDDQRYHPQHDIPLTRNDRYPGRLGMEAEFLNWYHKTKQKDKALIAKIIGRTLRGANDNVDAKEVGALAEYFDTEVKPKFKHKELTPEETARIHFESVKSDLKNLKTKVVDAGDAPNKRQLDNLKLRCNNIHLKLDKLREQVKPEFLEPLYKELDAISEKIMN